MTLFDKLKACILVPKARSHLLRVIKQLKTQNYDVLIKVKHQKTQKINSINTIVKSYFWASRTIKNCHCLPRSIALYQKLRSTGYEVEHKLGVNKNNNKMAAHSWVEYQNIPLNESKDLKRKFKVLKHSE